MLPKDHRPCGTLLALATACAALAGCGAAEDDQFVEATVYELDAQGHPSASKHRLSADQFRALVAEKEQLTRLAAWAKAAQMTVGQAAEYWGTRLGTTPVPGGNCVSLDVWVYDVSNGWAWDGVPRHIGCFRNPTQTMSGCTNFSGDGLAQSFFNNDTNEGPTWYSNLWSLWGGPCPVTLNNGPFRTEQLGPWAQANLTPPWSTLWILDD